jgi:hypothetical protein
LRQLDESAPNVKQANTAKSTKAFRVAQSVSFADNVKFDRVHQYVVFDKVASGSWDCQLMISWYVSLLPAKPSYCVGDRADRLRQAILCRFEHVYCLQVWPLRLRPRQPRRV